MSHKSLCSILNCLTLQSDAVYLEKNKNIRNLNLKSLWVTLKCWWRVGVRGLGRGEQVWTTFCQGGHFLKKKVSKWLRDVSCSVILVALCDPTDCDPSGFSVHEVLQERILEWVAFPFSRGPSLTWRSNLGLLHCGQILYHLSHWNFKQIPLRGIKQENKYGARSSGVLGAPQGPGHQDVSKALWEREVMCPKWHK